LDKNWVNSIIFALVKDMKIVKTIATIDEFWVSGGRCIDRCIFFPPNTR